MFSILKIQTAHCLQFDIFFIFFNLTINNFTSFLHICNIIILNHSWNWNWTVVCTYLNTCGLETFLTKSYYIISIAVFDRFWAILAVSAVKENLSNFAKVSYFLIKSTKYRHFLIIYTLESGIGVAPWINVASRKFDKKNERSPLKCANLCSKI